MIALLFVGDGERDAATVPALVETLLQTPFRAETRMWARLHGAPTTAKQRQRKPAQKGYERKLRFAVRQANDAGAAGVVATVDSDTDKPGTKLRRLRKGREAARKDPCAIPIALGEARPHGEAWLLDDAQAVRSALGLGGDDVVPSTREVTSPKTKLHALLAASPRAGERPLDVWKDIARNVRLGRCGNPKRTGFSKFVKDVADQLGHLGSRR